MFHINRESKTYMTDAIVRKAQEDMGQRGSVAHYMQQIYQMALVQYMSRPGRYEVIDADNGKQLFDSHLKDATAQYMWDAYHFWKPTIKSVEEQQKIERLLNNHVVTVTQGHMHALGRELWKEGWDSIRPLLVELATQGKEVSSKFLQEDDLERVILLLKGMAFIKSGGRAHDDDSTAQR